MYEPLKNRTYLGKNRIELIFFHFLGADFVASKSGHRREKQPVLGLDNSVRKNASSKLVFVDSVKFLKPFSKSN